MKPWQDKIVIDRSVYCSAFRLRNELSKSDAEKGEGSEEWKYEEKWYTSVYLGHCLVTIPCILHVKSVNINSGYLCSVYRSSFSYIIEAIVIHSVDSNTFSKIWRFEWFACKPWMSTPMCIRDVSNTPNIQNFKKCFRLNILYLCALFSIINKHIITLIH